MFSSKMSSHCSFTKQFTSKFSTSFFPKNVQTIGIVGAGQMGTGIAKVAAGANFNVLLMDSNSTSLDNSVNFIGNLFSKDVTKEKISSSDAEKAKSLVKTTTALKDFSDVDFVIEAATENPKLKFSIFEELDQVTKPNVILASNTSSISITKIGASTKKSDKVIGMHFMNPVPVMKLVEVISGLATSKETLATTLELSEKLGKTCSASSDYPGFIANRLLCPYLNEAFYALQEGIGSPEDIDKTMKLGTNVPMGPLTLADFIGLDTVKAIMNVLHEGLGDSKYRPCPLLVKYVEAGWLGKKTGRGVYIYNK